MGGVLLDTNVLSELMRATPAPRVIAWFERHPDATFHISTITRAEILLGIALLPEGKRRDGLAVAAGRMFAEFADGALAFDESCADEYALVVAARSRRGSTISTEDGQIAATALRHALPLATRNTKDFANIARLTVIDPWGP